MPQDTNLYRCREYAIKLLSRREYSRFELEQKLKAKGYYGAVVDGALLELKENGLQSDERFAACYARSRIERGCGPIRIQYELQNRGIAAEIIADALDEHKDQWLDLAQKVRIKKFGEKQPSSLIEQAKQKKFLLYRGFREF